MLLMFIWKWCKILKTLSFFFLHVIIVIIIYDRFLMLLLLYLVWLFSLFCDSFSLSTYATQTNPSLWPYWGQQKVQRKNHNEKWNAMVRLKIYFIVSVDNSLLTVLNSDGYFASIAWNLHCVEKFRNHMKFFIMKRLSHQYRTNSTNILEPKFCISKNIRN